MTSPMAPIVLDQQGWGDSIAKGLAPLVASLQERQQRELQKQQVLTQIGQLKLEQDKHAEMMKAANERKKALADGALAATEQIKGLEQPGPIGAEVQAAYATGDDKLIGAVQDKVHRLMTIQKMQQIGQKYQGQVDPMSQYRQAVEILQADPSPANASIVATLGSQVFAADKGSWLRANVRMPDGTYHATGTNTNTGEKIDLGEVPAPYTERFAIYGDPGQRVSARAALRMRNAYDAIKPHVTNDKVMNEVGAALTLTEGAATTPMNLGQLFGFMTNAATQNNASPEVQVVLNNMYEFLAAEGFGEGGKTLTATEWAKAIRQLAPLGGESKASRLDKFRRMSVRWKTHVRQAGPAWNRIKDLTPDEADATFREIDGAEEWMRQTSEEFGLEGN